MMKLSKYKRNQLIGRAGLGPSAGPRGPFCNVSRPVPALGPPAFPARALFDPVRH